MRVCYFVICACVICSAVSLDFKVVDLTHEHSSTTIYWPGQPAYNFTILASFNTTGWRIIIFFLLLILLLLVVVLLGQTPKMNYKVLETLIIPQLHILITMSSCTFLALRTKRLFLAQLTKSVLWAYVITWCPSPS